MRSIQRSDIENLKSSCGEYSSVNQAVSACVGATQIKSGIWRFFSPTFPRGGVTVWNRADGWKASWTGNRIRELECIGEDVFGNQIVFGASLSKAMLWHHEDGSLIDLFVEPIELIETVADNGVGWVDFYDREALCIAAELGPPPEDKHWHWIAPLVLGGSVSSENLTGVQRDSHLQGHGKLWAQIDGIPPGESVDLA